MTRLSMRVGYRSRVLLNALYTLAGDDRPAPPERTFG